MKDIGREHYKVKLKVSLWVDFIYFSGTLLNRKQRNINVFFSNVQCAQRGWGNEILEKSM